MPPAVIVGCAAASAFLAAALSRVAYRLAVPAGHRARARCPECEHPFLAGWRGWLTLPAQCDRCHARLGQPWWWGSVIAAGAALVLGWRLPAAHATDALLYLAWLVLIQAGVLLSSIDVAIRRLPTPVVACSSAVTAVLIAAAAGLSGRPGLLMTAFTASASIGIFYLLLVIVVGSQTGMGDVRVAALTGLLLGTSGLTAVVLGAVLPYLMAAPVAVAQLLRGGREQGRDLPFGPFLFAGAVAAAVLVR